MSLFERITEYWLFITIAVIFTLIKLAFLSHPLVSLEYMYTTPAQEIIKHDFSVHWDYLMYYFEIMSNPLLTSYLLIPGFLLFGFSEFIARLPTLLFSLLFLVVVYWFVARYYNKKTAIIAALLFALNPLIWVYSSQVTTDIFFTFFVAVSLVLCIDGLLQKKYGRFIISAFLLALAMITKYIALLYYGLTGLFIGFSLLFGFDSGTERFSFRRMLYRKYWKSVFFISLPYPLFFFIIVVPYLAWMLAQFGFIMHPNLVELAWSKGGVFAELPLRVLGYLIWIALFVGLFFLLAAFDLYVRLRRILAKKTVLLYLALLLALNGLLFTVVNITQIYSLGELHFGGLAAMLPTIVLKISLLVLVIIGEIVLLAIIFWFIQGTVLERFLSLWIIYSLVALATGRPTQRYLLLILVPLLIYLADLIYKRLGELKLKKMVQGIFVASVVLLLSFNLFVSVYEYKTGYAAKDIADYLLKNDIEAQIYYDVVAHNYYLLNNHPTYQLDKRKEVITAFDREYIVTDKGNLGKEPFDGNYEIVHNSKVEVFGILMKEFVVAKKVRD